MQSTNIILIIQKEGIEYIEKFAREQSKKYILDILNNARNRINLTGITYIDWNEANKDEIDVIKDISLKIEKENYSYSLYIQSPQLDKHYIMHYTNGLNENVFVPSALGAKAFFENNYLLSSFLHHADSRNSKEIEYE